MEYDEKVGTLINTEKVKKSAFDLGRQIRDSVLNVPDRIADQLSTMTDSLEINRLLDAELKQALSILNRDVEL